MDAHRTIKVGGACGYWGDWDGAAAQLLAAGGLDYIVFDYLAEITMSIMACARGRRPETGYAADFVDVIKANAERIRRSGVKILSNAGGVNPDACGTVIRDALAAAGVDLNVAVVHGDDLTDAAERFVDCSEMFSGAAFPDPGAVVSINAYIGAGPVAAALREGADIVITGRCVDSALTLGACMNAFNWQADDWNLLAAGSLAGHLLECGPQATGGNFTDWETVADTLHEVGYPIARISSDGAVEISKPAGTGGAVTVGTVAEQLLYEIGDPRAYMLPDVICDFSDVVIRELGENLVSVVGARGRAPSSSYKASVTFEDGWKVNTLWFFVGQGALQKGASFADAALRRANDRLERLGLDPFSETLVEMFGAEAHFGAFAKTTGGREVAVKIAAKHADPKALAGLVKEATALALSAPPGLSFYAGARPKPSPLVRLFSMLIDKSEVKIEIRTGEAVRPWTPPAAGPASNRTTPAPVPLMSVPVAPDVSDGDDMVEAPLRRLAWARSGDKGDKANIGVIARDAAYVPWLWEQLTEKAVRERFAHFLKGGVERYYLPGTGALNFLLHDALGGGGVASLRNDPQGKTFAQILLDAPIRIPRKVLEGAGNGGV